MPTPESPELLKNNLKLQVELELILLSIAHEEKALSDIKDKIKFMIRYFYSCVPRSKCIDRLNLLEDNYDELMKVIDYKKIVLESKFKKLKDFSTKYNIDYCFCHLSKNLCNCKKDPLFSKWV